MEDKKEKIKVGIVGGTSVSMALTKMIIGAGMEPVDAEEEWKESRDVSDYGPTPVESALNEYMNYPRVTTFVRQGRKVGRNENCPCLSGDKYKKCHGAERNNG